ncbi:MAG: hypothetical protein IPM35_02675 [Myxococcales bacterium]|nr:hypothetical protein [Myxococcales bacterium]
MTALKLMLVTGLALAATGCYSTTVRSGLPAGTTPMEVDDRWHSGFVGGTSEASGPYDMERICPEGWSEIETETSFANGLVELATVGVYNPQTVKVTCAAPKRSAKREERRQH